MKLAKRQNKVVARPRRITTQQMNELLLKGIVRPEDYIAAHGQEAAARVGILPIKVATSPMDPSKWPVGSDGEPVVQPPDFNVVPFPTATAPAEPKHKGKGLRIKPKQLKKLLRTAVASARTSPDEIAAAITAGLRNAPIQVTVKTKQPPPPAAPRFTRVVKNDDGSMEVQRGDQPFS